MKILHITNWYPSKLNPFAALWIKRHIDSLPDSCISRIYHIEIRKGGFSFHWDSNSSNHQSYILTLPYLVWSINEIFYYLILSYVLLIKERNSKFDVINFHIAYPILRYFDKLKVLRRIPVVITEHWSAYHYHFNLKGSKKLKPIQKIFHHKIPVITVSKSLGEDIKEFSGTEFENYVLPNIVEAKVFFKGSKVHASNQRYFLMVSQWKAPKKPLEAIRAFLEFSKNHVEVSLIIIGYGEQITAMKIAANEEKCIQFVGSKKSDEIAEYMRNAIALVHPSEYETFSVVCAEALTCGCPVIASKVGGIPEFVNDENGILLDETNESSIQNAMTHCYQNPPKMTNFPNFSSEHIGVRYSEILQKVIDGFGQ